MGIFDILFRNTGHGARTLAPANQSLPAGYRGAVTHDLAACTGCGTCAYACSPRAIRLEQIPGGVAWEYQVAQCTFCGRCEAYCPTGAIRLDSSAPAPQDHPQIVHHVVAYHPCERCGQPFIPLPAPVLARRMGREMEGEVAGLLRLCEKCRARVTSQRFKDSLTGAYHPKGEA